VGELKEFVEGMNGTVKGAPGNEKPVGPVWPAIMEEGS
jgi:hypothetical protein